MIMSVLNRRAHLILTIVLSLLLGTSSSFADNGSAIEADLMNVLRITLANQSDIKLGELDVESATGQVQAAGGRFDSTVFGNAYYEKNDSLLTEYEKDLFGYNAIKSESTGLEAGVRKKFRTGIEGEAAVRSTRVNDQSGLEGYPVTTRNVVEFSFTIPLLRGGSTSVTAEERKSEIERRAARQRYQKTISNTIAASASAYWDYLETYQALEIKKKIEQRTINFLTNTNRLIELGESPSADSIQISAQLASKRGERFEAERDLHEAKQKLGIAIGIPIGQLNKLGEPTDVFPSFNKIDCTRLQVVENLYAEALVSRGDSQAALLDEEAIKLELEQEVDALKPRLDIKLSANYEGVSEENGVYDPSVEDSSGPGGMILLNGEWPVLNNSAKGAVVSIEAKLRQASLRTQELERNIYSSIAVAAGDTCRTAEAAESLNDAVELYNAAVANEISRLKRGLTTLVNVLTVEDKRNSAQEDLIVQQSALAKAIVRLRNETGSLVKMVNDRGELEMESIVTLPVVEPKEAE